MSVLKRHEARYFLENFPESFLENWNEEDWGVGRKLWMCEIEKKWDGPPAPAHDIPFVFTVELIEDRGWILSGSKVCVGRELVKRNQSGEPIIEDNDRRLFPIGKEHSNLWVSDLI